MTIITNLHDGGHRWQIELNSSCKEKDMKKVLMLIDFSKASKNAAYFAVSLAQRFKTDLQLLHVFLNPNTFSVGGQVVVPNFDYPAIRDEMVTKLENFAKDMREKTRLLDNHHAYHPGIECLSEVGLLPDVVGELNRQEMKQLVVLGMSDTGTIPKYIFGSSSRNLIEQSGFPVLLVPEKYVFNGIHHIFFATDFNAKDLRVIESLIVFARYFDASLTAVHIRENNSHSNSKEKSFVAQLKAREDYDKLYFQEISDPEITGGLDWIARHEDVDIMVMVHRKPQYLDFLTKGSYAKKQADRIKIPLMVIPEDYYPQF